MEYGSKIDMWRPGKSKRAAVLALAELGDCGRGKPALIAALSDPVMTSTAANALRHLGHDPAEELRAQLTADRMGLELRRASAKALKEIGWVPDTPKKERGFSPVKETTTKYRRKRKTPWILFSRL